MRRGRNIVYIAAAIVLLGSLVALYLMVPDVVSGYVSNGLTLPVYRYGLLFPLIACGLVLSYEHRPILVLAGIVLLALTLWFGVQQLGKFVLLYEPLAALVVTKPVLTPAMGMATGAALLVPTRTRRWLVPVVCAICGLAAGLFILLESPPVYVYYNGWFAGAAAISCICVVITATVLSDFGGRILSGSQFVIAERICASWLIAASVMLAALAIIPKRNRVLDPTNLPPVQQRQIGDIVKTPDGTKFLWTGQGWKLLTK